ncbi:MAG: hypothetical protein JJE02_11070 [Propionibacteriales bacterium]|nr:hypothetical protein [Propionibacteriales bacterium]
MSIGSRLFDDSVFLPAKQNDVPHYVELLVTDLGLDGRSKNEQIDGVRAWLGNNTPSATLLRSIHRDSFGDSLHSAPRRRSA